jgi:FdhE protein
VGSAQAVASDLWTERRRRAIELQERWPFAAEVLTFYRALLPVQGQIYEAARAELADPSQTAAYVAERALRLVRDVTISSGPETLVRAATEHGSPSRWEDMVRGWLVGGEASSAAERFLVRAATGPVLEALGTAADHACGGPRDARHCPQCGGLPQVSIFATTGEDLVAPRRYLECARCARRWSYPRMTCAACGEAEASRLPIFVEEGATLGEATGHIVRGAAPTPAGIPSGPPPRFPHVTIHACRTCTRYLLNIDLGRDGRAVPVVDEMAAIPLDLYAREQGLVKVMPNLMGL